MGLKGSRGGAHTVYTAARFFSPEAWGSYQRFVGRRHARTSRLQYYLWVGVAAARDRLWRWSEVVCGRRVVASSPLQRRFPFVLNASPGQVPWNGRFTFQWMCDALRSRYRTPE